MTKPHQQFIERQRKARATTQFDADRFLAELRKAKRKTDGIRKSNFVAPIIGGVLEIIIHAATVSKEPTP